MAGINDNFSTGNGAEISAPSAKLKATVGGPFTGFDGTVPDTHFAHTFRLPPCKCLVAAKLEFRAKALGSSNLHSSGNDGINLGFSSIQGFPRWVAYLGSGNPPTAPWISSPAWGTAPLVRTISLDLAALPTSPPTPPGSTISLLSAMQTNGYLDFYVQDDTAIDYIKLKVTMCDCCKKGPSSN